MPSSWTDTARRAARRLLRRGPAAPAAPAPPSETARRLAAREGLELSVYQGGTVLTALDDDATPWRMPARAADAVAAALDAAAVPAFTTQPAWSRTTQWGVRRADLPAVARALRDVLGPDGFYVASDGLDGSPRLLADGIADDELAALRRLSLFRYVRCTATRRLFGPAQGTTLVVWDEEDGTLRAAARSGVVQEVEASAALELVPAPRWDGVAQPRLAVTERPDAHEIDFPVDAVYLWVDDSDPRWRARRDAARAEAGAPPVDAPGDETLAAHRFRDRGELRASMRSLETNAPWIRRIYLVTDDQRPDWLDADHGRVQVVDHREVFADPGLLPSYNSHAISAQAHRIPGLSDHYLLMNDDVMINRPVTPYDFFTPEGHLRISFSRVVRPNVPRERQTALEQARTSTAELLERDHGRRVTALFGHVPVPQRRDLARELEARYPEEIARTVAHRFRSPDDVVVSSWLHLYTALFTGRGVRSDLSFGYFNTGDPDVRARMDAMTGVRNFDVICLNDVPPADGGEEADPGWIVSWLENLYPFRAPFELDDPSRVP
ncbi:stealth conserved region 3 domain-containing protein [Cellulosimicrobium marinum]|uniref:stealth conserved region 3 domain-containing protein n=1 Tax=Cellulosimicrobium marinum TaxID=1638992 RepID=UPI001E304E44|nr:stealth conserved region 3 domain-containing protein [Cellulosimicrobium marinum]MCB7137200.1 stealth family protein [Cellulosimicrobium marinum]